VSGITLISVAHRPSVVPHHKKMLRCIFDGGDRSKRRWVLTDTPPEHELDRYQISPHHVIASAPQPIAAAVEAQAHAQAAQNPETKPASDEGENEPDERAPRVCVCCTCCCAGKGCHLRFGDRLLEWYNLIASSPTRKAASNAGGFAGFVGGLHPGAILLVMLLCMSISGILQILIFKYQVC
jgi:hypothetical protein